MPSDGHVECGANAPPIVLSETQNTTVTYTYRVTWNVRTHVWNARQHHRLTHAPQESDTPWATRWDNYLHVFDPVRRPCFYLPYLADQTCLLRSAFTGSA